jgi:protein TonB
MDRVSVTSTPAGATHQEDLFGLGLEYEDPKNVRWALVIAIGLHAVLFSLNLPGAPMRAEAERKKPHFVVRATPYKPPPVEQQQLMPERLPLRVPIPDPTPDGPELIRPPEEIVAPVRLPESDVLSFIPDAPPAAEPDRPLLVGGEVTEPVKIYTPPPRYTEIARRARIEGTVILEAIIEKDGTVTQAKVLKALPMGLDQAAVDAVTSWRFEPGTLRGAPVAVYYYLTVRFELN